jgi:hypothetical protein
MAFQYGNFLIKRRYYGKLPYAVKYEISDVSMCDML